MINTGYQVSVIASRGLEPKEVISSSIKPSHLDRSSRLQILEIGEVRLIQVSIGQRFNSKIEWIKHSINLIKCYLPSFLMFLYAAIKEKAQIYHCHDIDTLLIGYIASRVNHAKLVYDCHDRYDEIKAGGTFIKAFRVGWRLMERALIHKADGVITVCDSFAEILSQRYNITYPLILYNCPYFHPWKKTSKLRDRYNIQPEDKIVLYFGAVFVDRGVELLIESSQYFLPGTKLVLLGPASDDYRPRLEGKIAALPNPDRVIWAGYIPMKEVPDYLMSADISTVPYNILSSAYDTLPNKFFETMMAGLPIVTSNLPAMKRVIEETNCGMLVKKTTPETFAEAINTIISDTNLMKRMGANSRRAAEKKYNWENQSKKIIELYKQFKET